MSGEFVARMEDVLDLYHEEYDPERPTRSVRPGASGGVF